jgi:hypothetical protein
MVDNLSVSLPQEWIQEIKRMMMMYSTHGLFLTCTQKSHLYLLDIQILNLNIHTIYKQSFFIKPRAKIIMNLHFLGGPASCFLNSHPPWSPVWSQLPHPLAFAPFTLFPPHSPHYTIYKDDINNHGLLCPGH